VKVFQRTLLSAVEAAGNNRDALYTFGIPPTYPATGYGYLQRGQCLFDTEGISHYQLLRFREKPDAETARQYVASGEFYWNSGMFVWSTAAIIKELKAHLPEHLQSMEVAVQKEGTSEWESALERSFEPLKPISIDFGVMEKASNVRCIASRFEWSDLGGWLALETYLEHDADKNAHRGQIRIHQAQNNVVFCEEDDETVALIGVKDLIVVRAGKRTLIVERSRAEEIKELVKKLEQHLR
jgi:mannose-1-phosphate guanylyltransferase